MTAEETINHGSDHGSALRTKLRTNAYSDRNVKMNLNTLIDTGASKAYIKRNALPFIAHKIEKANIRVSGRYKSVNIREVAIFTIRLPTFSKHCFVKIRAAV